MLRLTGSLSKSLDNRLFYSKTAHREVILKVSMLTCPAINLLGEGINNKNLN